ILPRRRLNVRFGTLINVSRVALSPLVSGYRSPCSTNTTPSIGASTLAVARSPRRRYRGASSLPPAGRRPPPPSTTTRNIRTYWPPENRAAANGSDWGGSALEFLEPSPARRFLWRVFSQPGAEDGVDGGRLARGDRLFLAVGERESDS